MKTLKLIKTVVLAFLFVIVLFSLPIVMDIAMPATEVGAEASKKRWWISGTTIVTLSRDMTTLRVRGIGKMDDYGFSHYYERRSNTEVAPWSGYKTKCCGVIGDTVIAASITRVIIGIGVTHIGRNTFSNCPNITSITIPFGVIDIERSAFYDARCPIKIPASVIWISQNSFYNTDSIGVSKYNPEICSIDGVLFNKDKTMLIQYPRNKKNTSYSIPNGVTSIVSGTFTNTSHLKFIAIPNSMVSIGEEAFYACTSLTSITIPESITSIGIRAFSGCHNLTSVTIPNSVTEIGWYAFSGCTRLGHVAIPNSVTTISPSAFYNADSISVAIDNPDYTSIDGVLFNKDKTELIQYPSGKNRKYIIPDGVTYIGDHAFWDTTLISIVIPKSVTKIGSMAMRVSTKASIICLNPVPPSAPGDIFPPFIEKDNGLCIYVPKGSVDVYRNAGYPWSKIECIEALP